MEDLVQLANIAGGLVGRVVSVQRNSDHRSAACLREDGLCTIILRGLVSVAEGIFSKEVNRICPH